MSFFRALGASSCLSVLIATTATAQAPPRLPAREMPTPPTIDGTLAPGEWDAAASATGFVDPFTSRPVKDQTKVWIGYTKEAIYVAFYVLDSQPSAIVGREIQPGARFRGEDTVTFAVNPFGNRSWEGRSRFTVNVLNTQSDDIAGGRSGKREWRGVWSSGVKRVADGFTVEMRIPWRALSYPSGKSLSMDVNFERFQARTSIGSQWANTTAQERPELQGVWVGVSPPADDRRQRVQFLGYTAPEYDRGRLGVRSGVDARYQFTPTMTALASVNPDFRNIESQVQGIEFSYTERYLEEARPFFLEGRDFFELSDEFGFGRMFYSRRIENFDFGVKNYGQLTPNLAVGALTTIDSGKANATVARVGRRFGPRSQASLYATDFEAPGARNLALGGGLSAGRGNYSAGAEVASEGAPGSTPRTAGVASVSYSVPKVFSTVRYVWVDPSFAPPLAYIPWTDRRGVTTYNSYFTEYRHGPLRSLDANLFTTAFRTYAGASQQEGGNLGFGFTTRGDLRLSYNWDRTRYLGELASIQGVSLVANASNRYRRFGAYFESGRRGERPWQFLNLFASYRLFKRVDVGLSTSVSRFDTVDRLTIGTIGWEISPTRSLTGRVVQRNGKNNAYLAFRNGGGAGTEVYVILGDPNAESTIARLSVKVVAAF